MALEKDKFEYMCHKFNKQHLLIHLPFVGLSYQYHVSRPVILAPIPQLRGLWLLVSNDLSWSPHWSELLPTKQRKASWVQSVFHTRSTTITLILHKSTFRSLVEFKNLTVSKRPSLRESLVWRVFTTGISFFICPLCPCKEEELENASFFSTCGSFRMGRPEMTSISSLFHIQFLLSFPDKPPIKVYSSEFQLSAVLANWARLYFPLGWSDLLMALSNFDEAQHRLH
jgi:hypothetical protein